MDLKKAEILLERYWNCASTVAEEQELREFFKVNDVPDGLKESADLFKYFESQTKATLNEKFEEKVIEKIKNQPSTVVMKLNKSFKNYIKVAAVILVVLTASLVFRMEFWQGDKPPTFLAEDTYKTPEEAYAETKRAFMLIAEKMNSGRKHAERISILNQAENKIKKEEK